MLTLLLDLSLVSENSSNDKPMKAEFTPLKLEYTEVVVRRFSVKKVFLEISENSQENTCARGRPATLLKKSVWNRGFPVNFAKFLRASFFTQHLR